MDTFGESGRCYLSAMDRRPSGVRLAVPAGACLLTLPNNLVSDATSGLRWCAALIPQVELDSFELSCRIHGMNRPRILWVVAVAANRRFLRWRRAGGSESRRSTAHVRRAMGVSAKHRLPQSNERHVHHQDRRAGFNPATVQLQKVDAQGRVSEVSDVSMTMQLMTSPNEWCDRTTRTGCRNALLARTGLQRVLR